MQPSPVRDLIVGLFVALGLATIAYLSIRVGGVSYAGRGGLMLHATFDQVGGLKPRAPVAVAGVTVGQVRTIDLDERLRARVTLEVEKDLALPVDSSAAIRTQGLPRSVRRARARRRGCAAEERRGAGVHRERAVDRAPDRKVRPRFGRRLQSGQ